MALLLEWEKPAWGWGHLQRPAWLWNEWSQSPWAGPTWRPCHHRIYPWASTHKQYGSLIVENELSQDLCGWLIQWAVVQCHPWPLSPSLHRWLEMLSCHRLHLYVHELCTISPFSGWPLVLRTVADVVLVRVDPASSRSFPTMPSLVVLVLLLQVNLIKSIKVCRIWLGFWPEVALNLGTLTLYTRLRLPRQEQEMPLHFSRSSSVILGRVL